MAFTVEEIAGKLGCAFSGDGSRMISGVAGVQTCTKDQITFVESKKWLKKLPASGVGAIIARDDPGIPGLNVILHDAPQFAFTQVIALFNPPDNDFSGISSRADVAEDAKIATPVSIQPFASVGSGSTIGPNTIIDHGARIGKNVVLGEGCHIHANAVIEDSCVLGDRVIIHSSTVIGADGFGYIQHEGEHVKVPQIGTVIIGNDVEIGANTCIDRGAIGDTVIGDGVKIDNLVQIAHNVVIGDFAIIISQVGISGSSSVGKRAILAGKVGMKEHVHVGADAVVAAQSVVTKDIEPGTMAAGNPAGDMETWRKYKVIQRNLPKHWSTILSMISEYKKK